MKIIPLTIEDIDQKFRKNIKKQKYQPPKTIKGIQLLDLKHHTAEDGYFLQLVRFDKKNNIKNLPEFVIKQISYSITNPGGIKAWHLHYKQEDVWVVPPDNRVLVGLYDLRKNSPTKGESMKIILGDFQGKLLFIPRGVAHGYANLLTKPSAIIYLTNNDFNPNDPDEQSLPWDLLGKDFWEIIKG